MIAVNKQKNEEEEKDIDAAPNQLNIITVMNELIDNDLKHQEADCIKYV